MRPDKRNEILRSRMRAAQAEFDPLTNYYRTFHDFGIATPALCAYSSVKIAWVTVI